MEGGMKDWTEKERRIKLLQDQSMFTHISVCLAYALLLNSMMCVALKLCCYYDCSGLVLIIL